MPELPSRGWAPCSTDFPCKVSVLETHLYQSTGWHCCEATFSFSEIFWRLNTFAHFMMGDLQAHLPIPFTRFWPKAACLPPCLTFLFTWSHPKRLFFCLPPWMKKVLKGKCFANVKRVKQNIAEVLKVIKFNKFKTVLNRGNNVSVVVLHPMESVLKVTKV